MEELTSPVMAPSIPSGYGGMIVAWVSKQTTSPGWDHGEDRRMVELGHGHETKRVVDHHMIAYGRILFARWEGAVEKSGAI